MRSRTKPKMPFARPPVNGHAFPIIGVTLLAVALAGCKGLPKAGERQARHELQAVEGRYRPADMTNSLPVLTEDTGLSNYLTYAMLNQPQIEAAYFDWAAAVERITVERSRPDPRLVFSTDIKDVVEKVMLGLMQEFPGPGKLGARAAVASAESTAKYFQFETAVLRTAFEVKRAYYRLHFLEDTLRIHRENLALLAELERIARAQNEAGRVTLQDVLRAQIEQDRLGTAIANLDDARQPLRAQFKGALGLRPEQADPPVPSRFEPSALAVTPDQLLATALARNPRLRAMEAEVRMADAGIRLARKSKVPDYSLGVEVDVKSSPAMVRPQAGVSLPIWRDKITAEIAAAQNRKRAAEARLNNEQILLAVDFAEKLFTYRESERNLELLRQKLIPKAGQSLAVARAAYLAGQMDFFNLIDAERTLLSFQLAEVDARLQRELALAELSLVIAGVPPAGAPVLNTTDTVPSPSASK